MALLFLGLVFSFALGLIVIWLMKQLELGLTVDQERFCNFVVSSISFQGAGLVLTHFFLREHEVTWAEFLGLKGPNLRRALSLAVVVIVVSLPVILWFNEFMRDLITRLDRAPETQPTLQVLEISVSLGQRICFGFTAIVVAPVVEEILFRGILYRTVRDHGFPKLALFGSALLFGVIHGSLMTLLPLAALAIILALLYDRAGNLMAPIFAHALFNAVNFFGYLYRDQLTEWWKWWKQF